MYFDINNYKGKYVMHCKTEEEAIDFCSHLHKLGRKWCTGRSYLCSTCYDWYYEDTAYNFNTGEYSPVDYYKSHNYTILEWEDFMKHTFTKANLKTGDVVKRRNGDVEIVNRELGMLIRSDGGWNDLDSINDDLSNHVGKKYDIIAVRRPNVKAHCSFCAFELDYGALIYERQEVEEMTLEQVCKLLGKEIKIIK
jgi:hypothetical protein